MTEDEIENFQRVDQLTGTDEKLKNACRDVHSKTSSFVILVSVYSGNLRREVGVVAYVVIDKGRIMRGVNLNYPPFIL